MKRKAKEEFKDEYLPEFEGPRHVKCRLKFQPPTVDIDICIHSCKLKCNRFAKLDYFSAYCGDENCSYENLCVSCRELRRKARVYVHMKQTLMLKEEKEKIYEKACEVRNR